MSTQPQFLAVFVGTAESPTMAAWNALTPEEQTSRQQQGIAAWGAWMQDNAASIVMHGGPLGKTKRVSPDGVADTRNALAGALIVQADTQEAAAALFENHPHFSIFPGEAVEIMQFMPIPVPGDHHG